MVTARFIEFRVCRCNLTRYSNDNFMGLLRSLQKLDPHVSLNIENGVSVYFHPSGLVGMSFALVKI